MTPDQSLREHLRYLLNGGGAHVDFEAAVAGFPAHLRGIRPPGLPYSVWELLEHMRIAQSDILEFSRNPKHASPSWPEGYWPATPAPPDDTAWEHSVQTFRKDLAEMRGIVENPGIDLHARDPRWRWSNHPARGSPGRRSQRLPPGPGGPGTQAPKCMEMKRRIAPPEGE